jgi:hypothetical protein
LKAEKCPTPELTKLTKPNPEAPKGGSVSFGSAPWRRISGNLDSPVGASEQAAALNQPTKPHTAPPDWTASLAAIDASRPPAGFDPDRWRCLLDDARWLCRTHGPSAAALGWTSSDLFGLTLPNGIGGVADRLGGVRNLVLTDRIAHWRGANLEGWLWRETMRPMPLIWACGA